MGTTYDLRKQVGTIILNPGDVGGPGDTGAITSVTASVTSVTLVTANLNRIETVFLNDSDRDVWVTMDAIPAVVDVGIRLKKDDIYINNTYRGEVRAIWLTGVTGAMRITDISI